MTLHRSQFRSRGVMFRSLVLTIPVLMFLVATVMVFRTHWGAERAGDGAGSYAEALDRYKAGRYAEVIEILAGLKDLSSGQSELLGWSYLKTGDVDGAMRAFQRAVELNGDSYDSWCGLGFVHQRRGELDQAFECFEKGTAGPVKDVDCLSSLASALEKRGENERAARVYGQVLALAPDHREARASLEVLAPAEIPPGSVGRTEYLARGGYFWVRRWSGTPEIFYVKGVNLSFARPGKYITEFPTGEADYLETFRLIRGMNANVIRIYTILPPPFYRALLKFNADREPSERLLLIQGIWSDLPDRGDFREPAFMERISKEIRNAVDALHGRAEIPAALGHAHGSYRADVSNLVLAFIFGREWEPSVAAAFIESGPGGSHDGKYLSIMDANPMERWLGEMLDFLVGYEETTYAAQRPVAWMSWPPMDPISHPSEATYEESTVFRRKAGEEIARIPRSEIYDNDAVSLDEMKLIPSSRFRAGLFASHHVYPYYPEFLKNDARYAADPADLYRGYLTHLREHYDGIPLLVSEYGVPTSRAVARFHPQGFDHGGLDEKRHAEVLERMTADIRSAGCAGGIVFAWIDEWVKHNWMVAAVEENDHLWYNAMDPEESYGLLAQEPAGPSKLMGDPSAWEGSPLIYAGGAGGAAGAAGHPEDSAFDLERLYVDSDAGYLYVRLDVGGAVDWSKTAYLLALDTYGDEEGDHALPFGLGHMSPVGFEFVALLHGEESRLLIDDLYNRQSFSEERSRLPGLSGYADLGTYKLERNDNGLFTEMLIPHGRSFGRDGTVFPESVYNSSTLRLGSATEGPIVDWHYSRKHDMIELRIPWGQLYFTDPSKRRLLYSARERRETSGIRVAAFAYRPRSLRDSRAAEAGGASRVVAALPSDPGRMAPYRWESWEEPRYESRPKPAYGALQRQLAALAAPEPALHVPPQFDFDQVIRAHYKSVQSFLDQPSVRAGLAEEGDDLYGRAMANMAYGFVTKSPFHVLEAGYLLRTLRASAPEARTREAALQGIRYLGAVLSGGVAGAEAGDGGALRVQLEKAPRPSHRSDRLVLGRSAIRVKTGAKVRTQVDRVTRDWLSAVNFKDAPWVFSAGQIVPWHEGSRIQNLLEYADVSVTPVWGTRARKIGDIWYTPDAEGLFRFPIDADKVYSYPTNIFVDERNAIINDTHGISSLAWDALGADLAVGCGDHIGKTEAAYYLAKLGVDVYMPTDRYLSALIGTKTEGVIVGSGPIKDTGDGAVIGDQPVEIDLDEPVVVTNTTGRYPMQYYDTPFRYFTALQEYLGRKMKLTAVDVPEYGKAGVVVDRARALGARLIGIRVAEKEEHDAVAAWLREDSRNRAILFHTAVYPEGYRLFAEFPAQASFGDIHPELVH